MAWEYAICAGGAAVAVHLLRNAFKRKPRTRKTSFRERLLRKYAHQCMVCGYKKTVHAHHIDPFAKKGKDDPDKNGALLCPNCHAEADAGRLSKRKIRRCKARARKL